MVFQVVVQRASLVVNRGKDRRNFSFSRRKDSKIPVFLIFSREKSEKVRKAVPVPQAEGVPRGRMLYRCKKLSHPVPSVPLSQGRDRWDSVGQSSDSVTTWRSLGFTPPLLKHYSNFTQTLLKF